MKRRKKKSEEQMTAPETAPGRGIMILWGAMFLLVVLAIFNIVPISQGISPLRSRKEKKLIVSAEALMADQNWTGAAEIYQGLLEDSRAGASTRVQAALKLHEIYRDHLSSPGLASEALRSAWLLERDKERQADLKRQWGDYAATVGTVDRPFALPPGLTIIAEVGGDRVSLEEILLAWKRANPETEFTQEAFGKFVQDYMTNALLAEGGRGRGVQRDKTYLLDMRNLERATLSREMQLTLHKPAAREEVEAYYKAHPGKFLTQDAIAFEHIVVRTADEAASVGLRLSAGEDFLKLAKEVSLDRDTLPNGTELGAMDVQDDFVPGVGIIPGFARRMVKKDVGYTTGPLATARGHHWFRVQNKRVREPQPLDQVYARAEREMRQAGFDEARKALLEQLRKEIPMTLHEDRIKAAVEESRKREQQQKKPAPAGAKPGVDDVLRESALPAPAQ